MAVSARDYAPVPHKYLKDMGKLSDAEFGRLIRALLEYSATGEPMALSGNERFYEDMVMDKEDTYQAYFEEAKKDRSKRAAEAANARWKKKSDADVCSSMLTHAQAYRSIHSDAKDANSNSNSDSNTLASYDAELERVRSSGYTDELLAALEDWLAYKAEKRQNYKPTGLKALISEIKNNSDKYGESAVAALIRESMASNWQGIAFDRLGRSERSGKHTDRGSGRSVKQGPGRDWGVVYTVDGTQGSNAE